MSEEGPESARRRNTNRSPFLHLARCGVAVVGTAPVICRVTALEEAARPFEF